MAVGVCTHFAWEMKILHYWERGEGRAKNFLCMCKEYISDDMRVLFLGKKYSSRKVFDVIK